jgi:uncharacterized protein (DUF983 family)
MKLMPLILSRCPKCEKGDVFSGILEMHRSCPECDYNFYPEQGFYLGAMVVSYFACTVSVIPTFLLMWLYGKENLSPLSWVLIPCAQIAILSPILLRLSKVGWLHLEFTITEKLKKRDQSQGQR